VCLTQARPVGRGALRPSGATGARCEDVLAGTHAAFNQVPRAVARAVVGSLRDVLATTSVIHVSAGTDARAVLK